MIFGAVVRFILELCRRRGMRVPDLSRLRRRKPVFGVTNRLAEGLAASTDDYLRRRHSGTAAEDDRQVREAGDAR